MPTSLRHIYGISLRLQTFKIVSYFPPTELRFIQKVLIARPRASTMCAYIQKQKCSPLNGTLPFAWRFLFLHFTLQAITVVSKDSHHQSIQYCITTLGLTNGLKHKCSSPQTIFEAVTKLINPLFIQSKCQCIIFR